jgi:mRNA-degrading endonuclease RelE of RelBE toxin-antitoxin system
MKFIWPESARSELRAISKSDAMRILHSLTEYAEFGKGDLKALAGPWQGYFRLRIGEYRIILAIAPEEITIVRVRHRSEVYR